MKKFFLLIVISAMAASCDFIMKDRKDEQVKTEAKPEGKVQLGTDKDANGCVTSAGYRWSEIRKECIRVFEEGYRLNAIEELRDEDASFSAFVIFEDGGNRAELYLPDGGKAIMLTRQDKKGAYKNNRWSLQAQKGYTLKKDGNIVYAGAAIEENQITGDDTPEN